MVISTSLGLETGQRVWKTDDPELTRRLRRSFEGPPRARCELDIEVRAVAGEPLFVTGTNIDRRPGHALSPRCRSRAAETSAADLGLFREQLGRLGGTIYELRGLKATIEGAPMVPKSVLNQLRRELVARLDDVAGERQRHAFAGSALAAAHGADPV